MRTACKPPALSFLSDSSTLSQKAGQLFFLSRESLKRGKIDEAWKARRATAPKSLTSVLLSQAVTDAVRKELRRETGQRVAVADIERLLRDTVVRAECLS